MLIRPPRWRIPLSRGEKLWRAFLLIVLLPLGAWLLAAGSILLGGAGLPLWRYGEKVVCRVDDPQGRRHIEFVTARLLVFTGALHTPIEAVPRAQVVFDSGGGFWGGKKTLFPNAEVNEFFLSSAICAGSRIIGETVYIYPLRGRPPGYASSVDVIAVSEDGGKRFELRPTPNRVFPPLVVSPDGFVLSAFLWHNQEIQFVSSKQAVLRQTNTLYPSRRRETTSVQDPWILERRMQTHDAAKTWSLLDYRVLRPDLLPQGYRLVLEERELEFDPQTSHYRLKH